MAAPPPAAGTLSTRVKEIADVWPSAAATWQRHFDEEDLAEFVRELRQTLSLAYHDNDLTALVDAVAEWKATAEELADPARREVLMGVVDVADFVEVPRPERQR